jgi:exopolyphosphatase/pppGpp-phosphohydrolase
LSEKPLTRETLQKIADHAAAEFRRRSPVEVPAADRAIGSSGNVRAIGRMAEAVRGPAFAKTVSQVTPGTLEDIVEAAIGRTPPQIAEFFGLNNVARARIVMPAVAVLLAGMRHFDIRRLELTEAGLREGAAAFWSRHGHLNLPVLEDHEPQAQSAPDAGRAKPRR